MENRIVKDSFLGPVLFPKADQVMAPFIDERGTWEPDEIEWLKNAIKTGDSCLNIGANVGYFSKWMLRLSSPAGSLIAVEPNPVLIPLLKANLECETNKKFEIFEVAAGDSNSEGETVLFLNEKNFGDSRVFDPRGRSGQHDHTWHGFDEIPVQVKVNIVPIDKILHGRRVDVVLIDTQGWDYFVLKGIRDTIRRWRPKVLFELTPEWLLALGHDPVEILNECRSWGYLLGCPELGLQPGVSPISILEALSVRVDLDHVNVSLTPNPTFMRRVLVWCRTRF